MVRCSECKRPLAKQTALLRWVNVTSFIRLLYTEKQIEQETFEEMMEHMQVFKDFAYEQHFMSHSEDYEEAKSNDRPKD